VAVTSSLYPAPRRDRAIAGGGFGGGAGAVVIPRVRFWPFEVQASPNKASVAISTKFLGPAVIDTIDYIVGGIGSVGDLLIDFLLSTDSSGGKVDSVDTTKPPGQSILDRAVYADSGVPLPDPGPSLTIVGTTSQGTVHTIPLRRAVVDPEFFIKVYLRANAAGNCSIYGTLKVIEQLAEDQLPNFL
jgi:hypothetical protein